MAQQRSCESSIVNGETRHLKYREVLFVSPSESEVSRLELPRFRAFFFFYTSFYMYKGPRY